jgi:hypothetical protein
LGQEWVQSSSEAKRSLLRPTSSSGADYREIWAGSKANSLIVDMMLANRRATSQCLMRCNMSIMANNKVLREKESPTAGIMVFEIGTGPQSHDSVCLGSWKLGGGRGEAMPWFGWMNRT